MTPQVKPSAREARRTQTRERILGVAIAEFKGAGMAGADVGAIVAAAGVAHGTFFFFFFHFPSKEHVLFELEGREEARLAAEFARFLNGAHDLFGALSEVVERVTGLEQRLGPILFKELLALHFSPKRPTFFLLGIYGVLSTTENLDTRDAMLAELVVSAARGLEDR
jgi:TetR/AcrR family transcriptional regulator, repressor for uid operon